MIEIIPIIVECHSGFKADEYPKCFYWNNEWFEVTRIIDRWYQGETNPEWPVSDYFKLETNSDRQYIIKHELLRDKWYLCL